MESPQVPTSGEEWKPGVGCLLGIFCVVGGGYIVYDFFYRGDVFWGLCLGGLLIVGGIGMFWKAIQDAMS